MSRVKAYLISLFMVTVAASCVWASFNFETFGRISSVILFVLVVCAAVAYLGEVMRSYLYGEDQ